MHYLFKYEEQFGNQLVFFGTTQANKEVCIKFILIYSTEAHLESEKMGCTPCLRGFERLVGGWSMVMMDKVDDMYHHFSQTCMASEITENIQKKVEGLHKAGLEHSNICCANLLVKDGTKDFILSVDFDRGEIGKVTYPLNVNTTKDFEWPDGACNGELVEAENV